MSQREVYFIHWSETRQEWVCIEDGSHDAIKLRLVKLVAMRLRRRWRGRGHVLSQLKIMGKNGRFQSERTYGRDPKRFPG